MVGMSEDIVRLQNALFAAIGKWAMSILGVLVVSVAAAAVAWTQAQRDIQEIQRYKANLSDVAEIKSDMKAIKIKLGVQ